MENETTNNQYEQPTAEEQSPAEFLAEVSAKYEEQIAAVKSELENTKHELEQTRRAFNNLVDNRQSAAAVDGTMASIKKLMK